MTHALSADSAAAPAAPLSRAYIRPTNVDPAVRCAAFPSAARSGRRRSSTSPKSIANGATIAAVTRRYGIALPGNGFSSSVLGAMLCAILDREQHGAEDVGGKAVAGKRDAVAA